MKDMEKLHELQMKANSAKDKLISLEYELREAGFERKANSLSTIIGKLEAWQHKK